MAHGPEDAPEARRDKANYGLFIFLLAGVLGVVALILALVQPGNDTAPSRVEPPPTAMPAPPNP